MRAKERIKGGLWLAVMAATAGGDYDHYMGDPGTAKGKQITRLYAIGRDGRYITVVSYHAFAAPTAELGRAMLTTGRTALNQLYR